MEPLNEAAVLMDAGPADDEAARICRELARLLEEEDLYASEFLVAHETLLHRVFGRRFPWIVSAIRTCNFLTAHDWLKAAAAECDILL